MGIIFVMAPCDGDLFSACCPSELIDSERWVDKGARMGGALAAPAALLFLPRH